MPNYDIQMTEWGDLALVENDVLGTVSIKQQILIRLRWFLGEWRFQPAFGLDYFGQILVKRPNSELILSIICSEVRTVEGVLNVKDASLTINSRTREGTIRFTAVTTEGDFRMEMDIWANVERAFRLVYGEEGTKLTVHTLDNSANGSFELVNGDMQYERTPNLDYVVEHTIQDGDLLASMVQQ